MAGFDERKKAFENKFFNDEEAKFRVIARRRKLLGLWAAKQMNISDQEEEANYAMSIVHYGIENREDGAVVAKIIGDIAAKGLEISEETVRDELEECEILAAEQLLAEHEAAAE